MVKDLSALCAAMAGRAKRRPRWTASAIVLMLEMMHQHPQCARTEVDMAASLMVILALRMIV